MRIIKKYLKELGIYRKVISKRFNDKELYNLYQNALLFIFPSLKEGFGIPILEAWANKCPIALSNIEIFHEIADDAAIYFDPLDIEDIRNAIEKIIQNGDLRMNLIKKGYERVKKFNWFDSAKKLENIYKKVINKNSST
ncbi:MAG: glycosyltransferase [Paludibacteraceae bacterium]|nr:glycosyltransferase [Paludibacteraceae bacterium]